MFPSNSNGAKGILLTDLTPYAHDDERKIHQITHNDFSIDEDLLLSLRDENGWDDIVVRVYVRTHGKQSVFIRDGHYIDYLYNLDDDEIIQMLLGEHPWQTERNKLLFWKADLLEDSKYTDALLRRRSRELDTFDVDVDDESAEGAKQWCKKDIYNPDAELHGQCTCCGIQSLCPYKKTSPIKDRVCPYYTSRSIQDYIEILGYFHVLALIGKRIFHFKMINSGTQYVVVTVPLALSYPELDPEDYYPVVYLNGERVDEVDVSWHETCATNVDAEEMKHSDQSDLKVADIIPSNYSTRLKVCINKVYKETKSRTFANDVRYYKIYNGKYVRALVVEATPVQMIKKGREGDEDVRIELPFEAGVTYYSRINKEYRKLKVGVDYNVGDSMWAFAQSNQGYLLFTGLDMLDPNELAVIDGVVGDYVKLDDDETIYELHNEIKKGDIVSVELLDRRSAGSFEIVNMREQTPGVDLTHQFATLDSWAIYTVAEVTDIDGTIKNNYTPTNYEDLGVFDQDTYLFTFHPSVIATNATFLIIEGPNVIEDNKEFEIVRGGYHDDSYDPGTTGIIGEDLWKIAVSNTVKTSQLAAPLDSELVFINGKRLIPDLDYTTFGHDKVEEALDSLSVYGQCVSYLNEVNTLSVIRTDTTIIPASVQRGFVIGHHISWKGQTPIWFDELSTLTVDGKLIANYKQILGEMTLSPVKCRNGATYEVKTSVSTLVKNIMDYDTMMDEDLKRITEIHEFFIEQFELPDMTAIIPHSHRLYSIFLEAIISKYLTDETFEITRLRDCVDLNAYKQQFLNNPYFAHLYDLDTVFKFKDSENLAGNENPYFFLNYLDVYGIYHPLVAKYREDYDTLRELCEVFLPEDNIKHKEAKK